ncbi:unnamed protein product [Plasmodium vivax]|uniref:(malaria parasite P. vivax) hypothetical protein n=1 Tax=Plasmodium vivax TaxID=5855 RepID=A0A8S4H898_PLAVI|nr:unnamed protein product [Plasmodium vivax]
MCKLIFTIPMLRYPFLNKIWDAYKEYDKEVGKEFDFNSFYESNVTHASGDDKEKYKDICIKLLRNLKNLKDKDYNHESKLEYCTYLYHWLYKETKESDISALLISTIFKVFHEKMAHQNDQNVCPYLLYEKELYESKNLVKLSYLNYNYENIKSILKKTEGNDYCSCQKYLKDCVDIYIDMMGKFCTNSGREKKYDVKICPQLLQFQIHYSLITKDPEIGKKIPDIETGKRKEKLSNCPKEDKTIVPVPESPANTVASKPSTSSTVIGSMVGIPPFLVLIYKFTPAGKLFRFGNKKHTIITSDFDKEIENELFNVIQKDSNIKDIHSKYNIGYEPV